MPSKVGSRNQRGMIIEVSTATRDAGNNPTFAESDLEERWFSVNSIRGIEYVLGNQVHSETTHVLNVNNDELTTRITSKWKIRIRNRTFEVMDAPDYDFPNRPDVRLGCRELLDGT